MHSVQKGIKRSIRKRILSVFLAAAVVAGQFFVSADAIADAPPATFEPAENWEAYDYFNFAEALQKSLYFYDAEKCGELAGYDKGGRLEWRGSCHEGDAAIPLEYTSLSEEFLSKYRHIIDPDGDGTVDVHGGFHDAGDHVRFGLPQSYSAATLGWGFNEFRDAFKAIGEEEHMIEILRYFTDTFLRCSFLDEDGKLIAFCYMVGEGDVDHCYWGPPELYPEEYQRTRPADFATYDSPGSDVCASTATALATSYMNFKDEDPEYAERCLTVAEAMYDFAVQYRGKHKGDGYYTSDYDEDELAWAAAWLYECTGNMDYINDIVAVDETGNYVGYMKRIIPETFKQNVWYNSWVHCWDAVWGGTFLKLNQLFPENELFDFIARWNVEYLSGGKCPHEDPTDKNYYKTSPAGYTMINGWGSARYNTAAQLSALVYMKNNPDRTDFGEWAKGAMEYLMGRNPMGYSYIVGYGYEKGLPFAKHPHHRAAHGSKTNSMNDPEEHRHILWGALAGGPDLNDYHIDSTTEYAYNEVTIDYNAAFVGALAGLYHYYGQGHEPIPNFPPLEPRTDDYYCEAKVARETADSTQVVLRIHNESSQPPHYETGMMAKYFFNIDELFKYEQSIEDVIFSIEYDEQISMQQDPIKLRGPFKWDDAGTYYYEFDWSGSKIYGDRELQISFRVKQDKNYLTHWDSSNDYSKEGLTETYAVTEKVPVYLDGKLVFGKEPPKLDPKDPGEEEPDNTPPSIQLLYKTGEVDLTKNTLRSTINIKNNGTIPVKLSDIKVRYWFTNDGSAQNTFVCDYAVCGTENVIGNCYTIDNPVANADTYCEITFAEGAGVLAAGGSTGDIPFRIEGTSDYDKTNDYSYNSKMTTLGENEKITAYIKGELKYGIEPVKVENQVSLGDLDCNGRIDSLDFALMKMYLLGMAQLQPQGLVNADFNGDHSVDAIDFALFKKALLGGPIN
ncbi:glycoside hydrolase family 9 protein [Ruminiclostridium herbifermentans]|uniref:cellulase n=1 Tax=Ruminiclostridium herbifermentans TaxID=2488810 RepID=A0A4U7J8A8_9FIRM|nr:glycoside hydrolase family 9 protein [Ruminiclostridium herbifermentans]QNU68136.1 glycoside hydrolase family 9 protein [Ruminiclostridium herbifermentans]